jgi:Stage II sporulation protein E (SpoIIE)
VRVLPRDGDSAAAALAALAARPTATVDITGDPEQPQLLACVDDAPPRQIADDDDDLARVRALNATSVVVVPRRARGRRLGSLTLIVTTRSGRRFNAKGLEFAKVLAGRAALALDNAGLFSELKTIEAQLTAAPSTSPRPSRCRTRRRPDRRQRGRRADARLLLATELLATPVEQLGGAFHMTDEDGSPLRLEELPGRQVIAGVREPKPLTVRAVNRRTGTADWRVTKASGVYDSDGRLKLVVNAIEDITEVKRRRDHAGRARPERASCCPRRLTSGARCSRSPSSPGPARRLVHPRACPTATPASAASPSPTSIPARSISPGASASAIHRAPTPRPAWRRWCDSAGRSAAAAALPDLPRHTLRTTATLLEDPLDAVAARNRELLELDAMSGVLHRRGAAVRGRGRRCDRDIVCAGHPLPLLVRGGAARPIGSFSPLLGAYPIDHRQRTSYALEPGDLLVLFTAGVFDTVGEGERFGEERLERTLRSAADAPGAVARIDAADHVRGRQQADDTAILAVQRVPVAAVARRG